MIAIIILIIFTIFFIYWVSLKVHKEGLYEEKHVEPEEEQETLRKQMIILPTTIDQSATEKSQSVQNPNQIGHLDI